MDELERLRAARVTGAVTIGGRVRYMWQGTLVTPECYRALSEG